MIKPFPHPKSQTDFGSQNRSDDRSEIGVGHFGLQVLRIEYVVVKSDAQCFGEPIVLAHIEQIASGLASKDFPRPSRPQPTRCAAVVEGRKISRANHIRPPDELGMNVSAETAIGHDFSMT